MLALYMVDIIPTAHTNDSEHGRRNRGAGGGGNSPRKIFLPPPRNPKIVPTALRKRFDRARSIACESLMCAGSIAYDLIACRAIASDQDSLDIIGCSDDRNDRSLVCALNVR